MTPTISPPQDEATTELAPRGRKVILDAKERAWGWARMAQFLADNPDIAVISDAYDTKVLCFLEPGEVTVDRLADYTRRGLAAGARVVKDYDDRYGGAELHFGPVSLYVYSTRDQVCERVVTGTREVVEEVQDPEALAAVPTITQTRTEDIVEWVCRPILAADSSTSAAVTA